MNEDYESDSSLREDIQQLDDITDNALNDDTIPKAIRGKISFITPRLVLALDNAKVSNGMAIHILTAAAEALGHNVADLIINRSTLHRIRQEIRKETSEKNKNDFIGNVN